MADRPTGLCGLLFCYFAVYRTDGKRKWNWARFVIFGIMPLAFGLILAWKLGRPESNALPMIAAVLSVVAAVLLGLLPLIHSIVGQANTDREYVEGERPLVEQVLNRIQTLQDLHAAISLAVILLVIALGCCALLALTPMPKGDAGQEFGSELSYLVLILLYGIMSATVFTFFDVARGVFEGMESHSEALKKSIRNNIKITEPK